MRPVFSRRLRRCRPPLCVPPRCAPHFSRPPVALWLLRAGAPAPPASAGLWNPPGAPVGGAPTRPTPHHTTARKLHLAGPHRFAPFTQGWGLGVVVRSERAGVSSGGPPARRSLPVNRRQVPPARSGGPPVGRLPAVARFPHRRSPQPSPFSGSPERTTDTLSPAPDSPRCRPLPCFLQRKPVSQLSSSPRSPLRQDPRTPPTPPPFPSPPKDKCGGR